MIELSIKKIMPAVMVQVELEISKKKSVGGSSAFVKALLPPRYRFGDVTMYVSRELKAKGYKVERYRNVYPLVKF